MMNAMTLALFFSGQEMSAGHFVPTTGSGRSGFDSSQRGRRLRIGGSSWKFSWGGGDVAAHSSVQAFQGLSPADLPRRRLAARFHTNNRAAAAIKNAPMVETMFIQPQPGRSA